MYSSLSCTLSPPICVGSFVEFFTISLYFVVSSFPLQFFYLSAMGAVHKVRHARGGGGPRGCDSLWQKEEDPRACDVRSANPPRDHDAFLPWFQNSPIFPRNFSDSVENFPYFTFSEKFIDFHPQKILVTFFSNRPQISKSLDFAIPPISGKFLIPLYFSNIPPTFVKFASFLCAFHLPLLWPWCIYASHTARTGNPCVTSHF